MPLLDGLVGTMVFLVSAILAIGVIWMVLIFAVQLAVALWRVNREADDVEKK